MNSLKSKMFLNSGRQYCKFLLHPKKFLKITNNKPLSQHSKSFSTQTKENPSSYSIEEITIPNGPQYGYEIACKVWRGTGGTSSSSEPPIVCVHGWLDNANTFDTLLPKLMRPGRTFYAFDLPGHGFSSHIQASHYNSHVESHLGIHRMVQYLKTDKITLLGHSMGAEAAVMYAGSFPDGIHKVVTLDGVNPNFKDCAQSVYHFVNALMEVEAIIAKSPLPNPTTYDALQARIIKVREGMVTAEGCKALLGRGVVKVAGTNDMYRFSHDLKLRMHPGMAMLSTEQMSIFCENVSAPLLVIKAQDNDPFSLDASHNFQTAMENAKKRNKDMKVEFYLAKGNHHVHLNEPEMVANIISTFLDS